MASLAKTEVPVYEMNAREDAGPGELPVRPTAKIVKVHKITRRSVTSIIFSNAHVGHVTKRAKTTLLRGTLSSSDLAWSPIFDLCSKLVIANNRDNSTEHQVYSGNTLNGEVAQTCYNFLLDFQQTI
jgi:hypothetical protein